MAVMSTTTDVAMAKASGKFTTRMTSLIMMAMLESPAPPRSWISVEVPECHDEDEEESGDHPGHGKRQDDAAERRPGAGAEVLAGADHRGFDPREDQHHRHHGKGQVGGDHADHHREVGEEQPLERLVDDAEADKRVVDDAGAAENEPPGEGADERAGEEGDGEEHDQDRGAPRSAHQADDGGGRKGEDRAERRGKSSKPGGADEDRQAPGIEERAV